ESPVIYHPHPLSTEAYNELIEKAHIGLLLHDAHSYYSRLSAVFQEYVCSGIPVIVPAGCWLGDQIAEENFQYVQSLLQTTQQHVVSHASVQWSGSGSNFLSGGARAKFSFRGPNSPLAAEFNPPPSATEFIVQ